MVNYSHIIGEAMVVDVEALHDRFPLRQIAEKGPDGISRVQKVAAVEKWFRGSP